jgi:ribosomal protein L9
MKHRALVPLFALALSLVAGSAAAEDKGGHEKHFPMPAAAFKSHTEAKLAKVKDHLEAHIAKKQLPAEQAKELREKLAAATAKVNAQIEKATADGTVTKEEAKEVRAAMKEIRGVHGGKHPKKPRKP